MSKYSAFHDGTYDPAMLDYRDELKPGDRFGLQYIAVINKDNTWSVYMSAPEDNPGMTVAYGEIVPEYLAVLLFSPLQDYGEYRTERIEDGPQ